ncbi:hypothetical protein FACS1894167_09340 [Synergistales bacterium]|nr:hypothetical protein FACS1894167_09340 [Synergistales bacterium]
MNSVLVIDDDPGLLQMANDIIGDTYDVSLADSGEDALSLLESGYLPDIILLDIYMPGMDGYETLARLRKIPAAREIPVVFLTALDSSKEQAKGLLSGAADYLTKPFDPELLLIRLGRYIEASQERRRLLAAQKEQNDIPDIDEDKFALLTGALSDTEKQVARLIALGRSNREIAEELFLSVKYVGKKATLIFDKVGVDNRYQLKQELKKQRY